MTEKLKTVRGSANVFLDVGFAPDEAQSMLLRARLMSHLRDVARGNMLAHAGMRVELKVKKTA